MSSRKSKNSVSIETLEARLFLAAQHGLSASYYNGVTPGAGVGAVTRIDQGVDFYWGSASPAAGISADKFSARWTGQVVPVFSETYTFSTRTDEGVRLWVNGQLLIDHWSRHSLQTDTGSMTLTAGHRYDIKMEYFDYSGSATARLMWSSPSQSLQDIPASQLYAQGPYTVAAPSTNQRIEAENFDVGNPGVAYFDATAGNAGNVYRNTNVDLQATSDTGGGYNVGWSTAGEWLAYSVDVPTSGTYDVDVRLAASGKGGAFHVEVDDVNVTGSVAVPNTGGWQNWATVTETGLSLSAGRHVIKISQDKAGSNGYVSNLNWLQLRSEAPSIAITSGGATIADGQDSAISFGTVPFGALAPTRTFTVTNRGNGTLTLGVPVLPAGFTLLEGLSSTLAPGASDTFTVGMATSGYGSYVGTISIPTNDPNASQFTFVLNGNVPASKLAVAFSGSPLQNGNGSQVDFGTLEMGDATRTLVFTVSNQGQADLVLGTPKLPAGFTLADGLSSFLAPGTSDTFAVTMNTAATGDKGGLVSFTTNDPIASTFSFTIDGTITAPQIAMSVNGSPITSGQSSAIDFGSAVQSAAGPSLVFTVANQGNGALNLGTPMVPSGFTLLDAPLATIAAGASDTFTLQMNTATVGAISGAFSLPTNDYGTSGLTQGLFNFTLGGTVTAPPTNPVLVPGSGFTGATSQPAAVGTGSMSTENAIARWDVVPYQTFTDTFNVGVVAFDSTGIDHVSFSVNGGAWTNVSTMSVNPTTNVNEYWATLNASNFSDGQLEVRAIAYPTVGVPRVLQGATIQANGMESLFLNANANGTLNQRYVYVSPTGNDATADGTQAHAYKTLLAAATHNTGGTADNLTIYCAEGDYVWQNAVWNENPANSKGWLTITNAPGTDPTAVRITSVVGYSGFNTTLVKIDGITVGDGTHGIVLGAEGSAVNPQYLWLNRVNWVGPGPAVSMNGMMTNGFQGVFATSVNVNNTSAFLSHATLLRDVKAKNGVVAYQNPQLLINCTAETLTQAAPDMHPDVCQFYGYVEDAIVYGLQTIGTTISAQGLTIGPNGCKDVAIVNVEIHHNTISGFGLQPSAQNLYIDNSDFDSPCSGWTNSSGQPAAPGEFTATDVVVENSTFGGVNMVYAGVTVR